MLASGLVLGVAVGWLSGGRLTRLADLRIAWWPLLALAVAARLAAPLAGDLAAVAYVIAFAGIVVVAILNRTIGGMPFIAAGALLNVAVVAANAGMPVDQGAVSAAGATMPRDHLHIPLDASTRLVPLADLIPVAIFRGVYSFGDVLLALGGFWIPFAWMRHR